MFSRSRGLLARPELSALVIFVLLCAAFSLFNDRFLTTGNVTVYLQPIPELAIVAIGVTILMIAGEFDLSVGSVFGLTAMITVLLMTHGDMPMAVAVIVGLLAAMIVGFVNGWITLNLRIPSFIATLGMLFMARSLSIVLAGGFPPAFPRDAPVEWLVGRIEILGFLPRMSVIYLIVIALVFSFILRRTDFGHWIYATGGHTQAARDMGINTYRVKMACFMICSTLAGFAGIIQSFRVKVIVPNLGTGMELQAIAAAVIGGAALAGGIGSPLGAIVGAMLIAVIENILILSGINANWFSFAVGAMIVLAVVLNMQSRLHGEGVKG
jgi:ribose/xylose/arabinose/galactoside ABC-type transport system permease subunit